MAISKAILSAILPAASKDDGRYNLNGIHFKGPVLEATDGHRLHRYTRAGEDAEGVALDECIVERNALEALAKTLKAKGLGAAVDVDASNANGALELAVPTGSFKAPKIEGEFPNTDMVIPKTEPRAEVSLNARYLIDACKSALALSPGRKAVYVKVGIFDGLAPVRITATPDDGGEFLAVVMPARV